MIQADNFSFLILIFLSFALVKAGFDAKVFDSLPKMLFNLCFPALILISFSRVDGGDISQQDILFITVFAVAYTLLVFPIARYALRNYKNAARKDNLVFNMILGNSTFVGLPFIAYFFGAWGVQMTILFGVAQDFFIWSLCYGMFAGKGSLKQTLKVVLNPCFVAIIVGLALSVMQLEIPGFVMPPLEMLAGMTIPLALLGIGSLLAQNTNALRHIDRDAIVSVAIKTFALPAIVFAVLTGIGIEQQLVLLAAFITALPAGLLSVMFVKEFNKDIAFANVAFVVSTLTFILMCVALFVFI